MKIPPLLLSALLVVSGWQARADNFVTIAPTGATAAVVTPRWAIGSNLAGLGYIDGNSGFAGATATNFFSITGAPVPVGGTPTGFTSYLPTGAASSQASVGNALTAGTYAGLTYVAENLSLIGPLSFYTIHQRTSGDYLALIQPGSPTVSDQKPMSVPGGPATGGATGYFALSYAAPNAGGWGANLFYYLRRNALGETIFGSLVPALLSGPTDRWNLGAGRGFTDLAYTATDIGFGFGPSQFYYLRLDPLTQTTFFGRLDPMTGVATDIQDLAGVYRTLVFAATNVGYGANLFYTTGRVAQTLTFAPVPGHSACDAPFTFVAPTSSAGLPVTVGVSGPATILGNVVTLTGTPGTVVLTATQAGNLDTAPAPSVTQSFVVTACAPAPGTQTITFLPVANRTACDAPFAFSAPLASSGLPITLAVSGPATVSGSTITLTGAVGTVVLTASQGGNGSFSAAVNVAQSFVVAACITPPTTQTITFAPFSSRTACDAPFSFVVPAASSGLPVTLAVSGPATISGNTVTLTGVTGTVTVTASQAGDTTFAAASSAIQSFTVSACAPASALTPQAITFALVPDRGLCDPVFTVNPTASSGLPVALIVVSGPATLSGNTVTITGAGAVTLQALQPGNSTYASAAPVIHTFNAAKCAATVTLTNLTNIFYGRDYNALEWIVVTTSPAGLPVTLTHEGSLTVPAAVRSYNVVATIDSPIYAGTATATLVISADPRVAQTVTFGTPLTDRVFGDGPFTLNPSASSGMPTILTVLSGPATISGNIVTLTGAGTVVLEVSQPGDIHTFSYAGLTQSFVVAKAAATVTLGGLAQVYDGSAKSAAATTMPAGLPVTFTYDGSTSAPSAAGTYAVRATIDHPNYTGSATGTLVIAASSIVNFSVRSRSAPGAASLIAGFVVAGNGKELLIRGVGPALAAYGVVNPLADPLLTISSPEGVIATNDDWQIAAPTQGNQSMVATAAARVGAFALANGSKDAALLVVLNHGAYTAAVQRPDGTAGIALTEIYDANHPSAARVINFSARSNVSPAEGTLIVGVGIVGSRPKTLLIRSVGPGLAGFGVPDVLADPRMIVYSAGAEFASNDNWESGATPATQLATTAAQVGAFALQPGSKDSALLISLPPGSYTVHVSGVAETTGIALVEIYDIP